MRRNPRIEHRIYLLGAVTGVSVRDLVLLVLCPAFGTAPGVSSRGYRLNTPSSAQIGVFLEQFLLLVDGVFGPALDARDVEADEAGDAAPDGLGPLDGADADEAGGRVQGVVQRVFSDLQSGGVRGAVGGENSTQ